MATLSTRSFRWGPVAAVLLGLAGLAAYGPTFSAPFFFDDLPAISDNPTIRHLGDLGAVLSPPSADGNSVGGRPFVNLTFAVNYAISGNEVWSYHALNLLIHVLAALTLYGIVRRTLEGRGSAFRPPVFAFLVALLWLVHPLQTESVTCVVQRTESLLGLFYLLTLYCFVRGAQSAIAPPGGAKADKKPAWEAAFWFGFSWLACLLGMATKEVMVTAPVLVFLYDRTFLGGSFREAWRRRWGLHLALASTWILLAILVAGLGGSRGGSAGFGAGVSSGRYALTQCRAVVHYLHLAVWPHPLVVDYGTGLVASGRDVWPQAIVLGLLVAGTGFALWRRPVLGFLGAWFFVILAPSSSIVPLVTQTTAEHRMYLPLAAVVILGMAAVRTWAGRGMLATGLGLAAVLAALTFHRNETYRSAISIWSDTVAKVPANARARNNLGEALRQAGRIPEAIAESREAVRLRPGMPEAHFNLGAALWQAGEKAEAAREYAESLRLRPDFAPAHLMLGGILLDEGKTAEALRQYAESLRLAPGSFEGHYDFGNALFRLGQAAPAADQYVLALAIRPDSVEAQYNAANALAQTGSLPEAVAHFRAALRLRPDFADAHFNLAGVLAQLGQPDAAAREYREVLRLQPGSADAQAGLARLARGP